MNNELEHRRPATIVDTRAREVMVAGYLQRADLAAAVRKAVMRGEVRPLDARPVWHENRGRWEQRVVRLKPPAPAWRKPVLIGAGILATSATLFGLAWWVLASLAALPLGALCVAAVVALGWATRAGRSSGGVDVITSVSVSTSVRIR